MRFSLLFSVLVLGFLFCTVRLNAQTAQVSPVSNLQGNNASIVNNNEQILQAGVNGLLYFLGQYFSNGILNTANGGTGQNSSAWASGDTVIMANKGTWGYVAPGTSGQFFETQGVNQPPIWATIPNLSNVLFQYQGQIDSEGAGVGEITGTILNPNNATGNYRFLQAGGISPVQVFSSKFTKIAGINTITVYVRSWVRGGVAVAFSTISVGGQTASISSVAGSTTPTWYSGTINVSSLTNGTTYDVTTTLYDSTGGAGQTYLANIVGFGS